MKLLRLITLTSSFFCQAAFCFGQQPGGVALPSSLVVVFENDPGKFSSLLVDGQPVPANQVPIDYPSTWPVPAGKRDVVVSAAGAEDVKTPVEFSPEKPTLIVLALGPNKDSSKLARFPQQIGLTALPLEIPMPKADTKTAKVFAFVLGSQGMEGVVLLGRSAPKKIQLPAKKLVLLGEESLELQIGGQSVVGANPGDPGAYIFALLPLQGGKVRALPFTYTVQREEKEEVGGRVPED